MDPGNSLRLVVLCSECRERWTGPGRARARCFRTADKAGAKPSKGVSPHYRFPEQIQNIDRELKVNMIAFCGLIVSGVK